MYGINVVLSSCCCLLHTEKCMLSLGMLTLELSSIVLEIPNDAYVTLSQNLIGCSTLSQECGNLIG